MKNCIICIEPCNETMKCCQAHIHVGCLQDTLEKGFNKCPHCQHEIYTQQEQNGVPPQPIASLIYVPVTQPQPCAAKTLQGIGAAVLFILGFGLLSDIVF